MYLCNAFSLNMLRNPVGKTVRVLTELGPVEAADVLSGGYQSAVGHQPTADLIGADLGMAIPCLRLTLALTTGDQMIVAQYRGPRLPEGVVELPAGAELRYYHVVVS